MRCPKCHAENEEGAFFCRKCGASLHFESGDNGVRSDDQLAKDTESADELSQENEGYIYCWHCGAKNPVNTQYCEKCQKRLLREETQQESGGQNSNAQDTWQQKPIQKQRSAGRGIGFVLPCVLVAVVVIGLLAYTGAGRRTRQTNQSDLLSNAEVTEEESKVKNAMSELESVSESESETDTEEATSKTESESESESETEEATSEAESESESESETEEATSEAKSESGSETEEATSESEPGTESEISALDLPEYTASDYVTLGEYIGVTVEVEPVKVTDEEVQEQIASETVQTLTEGTVEEGDTANIDYVGTLDGEEFDGGSAEGYDLEIGSDTFIRELSIKNTY